jgi:choline dehydrogenase-like flavoprotein
MILQSHASEELVKTDVCIIGGGPAAISVALEVLKGTSKVVVLVGGGATRESASDQDLNRGVIARPGSHEGLEENRRRVFGGASTAWGGRCIPYDPVDFKARSWIPDSGWPFAYEALAPYYERALQLCRAGRFDFDSSTVFAGKDAEIISGLSNEELDSGHLERWSPPVNFGSEFESQLTIHPNLTILLNTHALEIESITSNHVVEKVRAISRGKRFGVEAKIFVLATGGIENARILLASRGKLHPNGIGNERDLVGRYYQAHPHGTYALLAPADRKSIKYEYETDSDGVYCRRRWWVTEKAQTRLAINNIIFFLDRTNSAQGHRDVVFSAVFVAKAALSVARTQGLDRKWLKLRNVLPTLPPHLAAVAKDGVASMPRLTRLMWARMQKTRRLPSILPSVHSRYLGLYFQAEQTPNSDSRVTLAEDQLDEHGMPRAKVDLRFTDQDLHTVVEAHRLFVERYHAARAGEIVFDEQGLVEYMSNRFLKFNSAAHHIGTTRMALSPEKGVVNENSRVHGIDNLYVAGSSVFPTGGHANPTLTIVALSIRLGEHIAEQFARYECSHH